MEPNIRQNYLGEIHNEDTRAGFQHLLVALPSAALRPSLNSGHVKAVRFHDELDRYVFSFIVNRHHLLFYIRKPALNVAPHLAQKARRDLSALQVKENPAGEITVRIETKADAQKLTSWLAPMLPLPF